MIFGCLVSEGDIKKTKKKKKKHASVEKNVFSPSHCKNHSSKNVVSNGPQPHEVISTSQSVGRNVRYISFEFTYKVIDLNIDFEFQSSIFAKSRLNKLGIHI